MVKVLVIKTLLLTFLLTYLITLRRLVFRLFVQASSLITPRTCWSEINASLVSGTHR